MQARVPPTTRFTSWAGPRHARAGGELNPRPLPRQRYFYTHIRGLSKRCLYNSPLEVKECSKTTSWKVLVFANFLTVLVQNHSDIAPALTGTPLRNTPAPLHSRSRSLSKTGVQWAGLGLEDSHGLSHFSSVNRLILASLSASNPDQISGSPQLSSVCPRQLHSSNFCKQRATRMWVQPARSQTGLCMFFWLLGPL